ncbi:hypothetical protein MNBD_GAMMA09-2243 [hydrothermal vent metagenome]|uniref:Serine aminopeptidase S33 domain-containing protein n=1 Tax=hydrothermal vent metagenome TaxID=652676 RepID=A0A3B0XUF1_9ZZZZ
MNKTKLEVSIILLPGLDGTGELFKPLLDVIESQRSVRVIDYPVDVYLGYSDLTKYVADILKDEVEVFLVAESFSGPIAIRLLFELKDKIKGVVLVASFISPPQRFLLNMLKFIPADLLFKYDIPDYFIKHYCLGKGAGSESIRRFKNAVKLVKPEVLKDRFKAISELDFRDFKTVSNKNVFYINASNDRLVKGRELRVLKKIIDVKVFEVDGPHFLLQARPVECGKLILKYSESC